MTADRRAALVEKVADVMGLWLECDQEFCEEAAANAISLIRADVLEEAAKVADRYEIPLCETSASHIAAAIRALKGGT
jgi:ethanolamine ammonia-lyase large subunit